MGRSIAHLIVGVTLLVSSIAQANKQGQSSPGSPRIISLSLAPSQVNTTQKGLSLLPFDDGSSLGKEGNGASFYTKAAQGLPAGTAVKQLGDWTKMPLQDLPQDQVQGVLQQAKANLDLVGRGAKCKGCNWPPFVPGSTVANLSEYRQLAFLLCLKGRLEIAQGQYDKAVETIRTGLAMSKHISESPTIIQGMTGIAMVAVMLRPMEDLAQTRGSPNLCAALHALPRPVVNIEVPIASELKTLDSSTQYSAAVRNAMRGQLEEPHKRVRVTASRLDSDVTALECIEALRHFAATHSGRLPAQLSDITDIQVPNDPATGKPFAYRIEGSKAILETSAPKDGTPRDSARYEITIRR